MVRILILIVLFFPFTIFTASASEPITGDSLKQWLSSTEDEHRQHGKEVKSDKLHELLLQNQSDTKKPNDKTENKVVAEEKDNKYNFFVNPAQKPKPAIKPEPVVTPELKTNIPYIKPGNPAPKKNSNKIIPVNQTKIKQDPDRYTPPSWVNNSNKKASPIHSGRSDKSKKQPVFGIRLGTEFRARLVRTTTNVDPTFAEFVVVDDVYGDYKMLHKNTQLFASKKLSTSSNRLYFNTTKGITPEGKEFTLSATVTDITTNKLAGLTGAITTDNKMMKRSLATGAFAAGGEVIKSAPGVSILGQAATTAASTALTEKQSETEADLGDPKFVIFVNPQDVFIRVDKTF